MKKMSVFLAVLMMVGFTGTVSAASLAWSTPLPVGSTVTLDDGGPTISASFGFGASLVGAPFSHVYNFTSSSAGSILAIMNELPHENIDVFNITFDGVAMGFDAANQRWFGLGANTQEHTIMLNGVTDLAGSAYQLTALSVSNAPIPAAIWLFGSAFAGLIGVANGKKGKKILTA